VSTQMCTVLLPPGVNAIAVNKYIISYHIIYHISYRIIFGLWPALRDCVRGRFETKGKFSVLKSDFSSTDKVDWCNQYGQHSFVTYPYSLAYEDGTDRVLRNVGIYTSDVGESPRRQYTTRYLMFCWPCIVIRVYLYS
jgi:hypothetical protein